jgi:hypothetical protein
LVCNFKSNHVSWFREKTVESRFVMKSSWNSSTEIEKANKFFQTKSSRKSIKKKKSLEFLHERYPQKLTQNKRQKQPGNPSIISIKQTQQSTWNFWLKIQKIICRTNFLISSLQFNIWKKWTIKTFQVLKVSLSLIVPNKHSCLLRSYYLSFFFSIESHAF